MKYRRQIGVIPDTHTGSTVALWPEGFFWKGRHIPAGEKQAEFNPYWEEAIGRMACCDTIFLPGDMVEGLARKEGGANLMVSELNGQVAACVELLKPMCKKKSVHVWSGSGYHESFDYKLHSSLATELNGQFHGVVSNMNIRGTNIKIHVRHAGPGGMTYRASGLDKDNKNSLLADAAKKVAKPDLIIEGHHHYYNYLDTGKINGKVLKCPCWKAWEPSPFWAKNYHQMQPDIGSCIVRIDTYDTITVEHLDFPLPHIADDWIAA